MGLIIGVEKANSGNGIGESSALDQFKVSVTKNLILLRNSDREKIEFKALRLAQAQVKILYLGSFPS